MTSVVLQFVAVALLLVCIDGGTIPSQRGSRQFDGFNPFGPSRGPFPGPFSGPNFVQGNFLDFGPPGAPSSNFGPPRSGFRPLGRSGGMVIPSGSGNIIPRQANINRLRQHQPIQMQRQIQQQTQQQKQQTQQNQQQMPNRNSPAFRQCLANCLTTNEYNPVCGNDQQDYYNEQRLLCANRCGMNVQTVRRGTCSNSSN